jgi:predicted aspartyl protease
MGRRLVAYMVFGWVLTFCGWLLAQEPPKARVESQPQTNRAVDDKAADELGRLLKGRGYVEVPILLSRTGYLMVSVSVGEKNIRLLLDTGAAATCLDLDRTRELKLNWDELPGSVPLDGFPSWDMSKKCKIEVLDLSGFKAKGVVAHVYKVGNLNKGLEGNKDWLVDGVLGGDFCRAYSAIIDYPSLRMFLQPKK